MSNGEEQLLELEALESLFPEEMRRVDDKKFSLVNLLPFSDHSQTNHVSVSIDFEFPPGYPSSDKIHFSLSKLTGPIATDSTKTGELSALIHEEIEANVGMCAVYQVVERVTEWLRANNEEERSLFDQMSKPARKERADQYSSDESNDSDWSDDEYSEGEDDDSDSEDLEEDEEYHGLQLKNLCAESARVSDEQFGAWRVEYEKWLMASGVIKRSSDNRPTGKEQFLNNLANRTNKGEDKLVVDASLFDDEALLKDLLDDEDPIS